MKHTAFYTQYSSSAVLREFPEWDFELADRYSETIAEYNAIRNNCAILDLSFQGRIRLTGKHVLDFLNRLSTNEVKSLKPGHLVSTVLTSDKGRIIDLVRLYHHGDHFMMVTGPNVQQTILSWLDKYIIMDDVHPKDVTDAVFQILVSGPGSKDAIETIFHVSPDAAVMVPFTYEGTAFSVAPSDRLNTLGFEIFGPAEAVPSIWKFLSGKAIPAGQAAFEMARVEDRKPEPYHELSEKYNPLEAGLTDSVSFTKGCYIGQEVIARLDSYNKVQRHLVQLKMPELVSPGAKIQFDNRDIGTITSASHSPREQSFLALGFIKTEFVLSVKSFTCLDGDRRLQAHLVP